MQILLRSPSVDAAAREIAIMETLQELKQRGNKLYAEGNWVEAYTAAIKVELHGSVGWVVVRNYR
jgi:hypothetical protein